MAQAYTAITILYNPISTGSSKENAEALYAQLQDTDLKEIVSLCPTEYARHAETLAYELAKASKRPLIISSSGDGTYNEIVNAILKAQDEGHRPACGLLPSGNANDHHQSVNAGRPLVDLILSGEQQTIDVLRVESRSSQDSWSRYAHSYIGIGLTPHVGKELNKTKLNLLREVHIVFKALFTLPSVTIKVGQKPYAVHNLVFSNASKMSKILTLSDIASMTDGKFEITADSAQNKFMLLRSLLQASTTGLKHSPQADTFAFSTICDTDIQCDGEIFTLQADSKVTISCVPHVLHCVV